MRARTLPLGAHARSTFVRYGFQRKNIIGQHRADWTRRFKSPISRHFRTSLVAPRALLLPVGAWAPPCQSRSLCGRARVYVSVPFVVSHRGSRSRSCAATCVKLRGSSFRWLLVVVWLSLQHPEPKSPCTHHVGLSTISRRHSLPCYRPACTVPPSLRPLYPPKGARRVPAAWACTKEGQRTAL